MREILFRGKQKDNNEWIEGYYAVQSNHACFAHELKYTHFIFKDIFLDFNLGGLQEFEVIPETVGQYTGLTDKNGKRIFEGDIVYSDDLYAEPLLVIFNENCGEFQALFNDGYSEGFLERYTLIYHLKVIGNIHDSPELLERNDGNA